MVVNIHKEIKSFDLLVFKSLINLKICSQTNKNTLDTACKKTMLNIIKVNVLALLKKAVAAEIIIEICSRRRLNYQVAKTL